MGNSKCFPTPRKGNNSFHFCLVIIERSQPGLVLSQYVIKSAREKKMISLFVYLIFPRLLFFIASLELSIHEHTSRFQVTQDAPTPTTFPTQDNNPHTPYYYKLERTSSITFERNAPLCLIF
ncbi:hypothetical protein CEXT_588341 [Caerostris extrusa]|uniref:Transmembrane protein n=1 Tax=Caerostris extrusa TaxID=172846 RepID=A0AAV4NNQ2_CAEEX|nr:hypothetical protein CEXT_588341 [Caerostris extrusa]